MKDRRLDVGRRGPPKETWEADRCFQHQSVAEGRSREEEERRGREVKVAVMVKGPQGLERSQGGGLHHQQ